jgi:hypothetical protein
MLPNFLFIGPDKTGSSWLYELLHSHPQCFVPECKDIYFFDRYYGRGLAWYGKFFADVPVDVIAIGELSHDYLFSRVAADRILHDLANVKLITSLRNPVERTFSHYLYMIRSGRTRMSFEEALEHFPELIENSLYHRHLSYYFERFSVSDIKVLWFEQLVKDPRAYGEECLRFLGLDQQHNFDYGKKVRLASKPRNYWLARTAKVGANVARALRFENLVGLVKHSRVAGMLYKEFDKNDRPKMEQAVQEKLVNLFRNDIQELEKMLNVNLSHWYVREQK